MPPALQPGGARKGSFSEERARLARWRRRLAVAGFPRTLALLVWLQATRKRLFWRDAKTSARDARAPQNCSAPPLNRRRYGLLHRGRHRDHVFTVFFGHEVLGR